VILGEASVKKRFSLSLEAQTAASLDNDDAQGVELEMLLREAR
jgi:hypothetical protein